MDCTINNENAVRLLAKLINSNKEMRSFQVFAISILGSALSDAVKATSIKYYANIYKTLYEANENQFSLNINKIDDALSLVDKSSTDYVQKLGKRLQVNVLSINPNEALSQFESSNRITVTELNRLLYAIGNYVTTNKFENDQSKQEYLDKVKERIKIKVTKALKNNPNTINNFNETIDDTINRMMRNSLYIRQEDFIENLGENIYIIQIEGNKIRYAEGYEEPDTKQDYIYDKDGMSIPIEKDRILKKFSRKISSYYGDSNNHVWTDKVLSEPIDVVIDEYTDPQGKRTLISDKLEDATVYAVKLNDVADKRVADWQSKSLLKEDYKDASRKNRNHETFENENQINYLINNSKGVVITVSRPKSSEQGFALMGRVHNQFFNMYGLENYVFVYADNTTKKIDFFNPEHIQLLKENSVKTGNKILTNEDIERLQNKQKIHDAIWSEVKESLESMEEGDLLDITKVFNKHIKFEKQSKKKHKPLRNAERYETQRVQIIKIDKNGQEIEGKREFKNVPIVFSKRVNIDSVAEYYIVDFLQPNERIKDNNKVYTWQQYVNNIVGITEEELRKNEKFTIEDAIIKKKWNEDNKPRLIKFFITYRDKHRAIKWRPLDKISVNEDIVHSTNFLIDIFTMKGKKEFQEKYRIPFLNTKESHTDLAPKYEFVDGKLFITFEVYSEFVDSSAFTELIKSNIKKFSIELDSNEIRETFVKRINNIIKPLLGKDGFMSNNELFGKRLWSDYQKTVNLLLSKYQEGNHSTDILKAIESLKEIQRDFGEWISSKIDNHFNQSEPVFKQFKELFNKNYNYKNLSDLIVQKSSQTEINVLRIYSPLTIDSFNLIDTITTTVAVVPKIKTSNVEKIQEIVEETVEEKDTPIEKTDDKKDDDIDIEINDVTDAPFALDDGSYSDIEKAEFNAQLEWLSKTLGTEVRDIERIRHILRADKKAFGVFLNDIIYLDKVDMRDGVIYHEAFHKVFRRLLTNEERAFLTNEILSNEKYDKLFTQEYKEKFAKERNIIFNNEKITALIVEEILADDFRDYKLKQGTYKKKKQSKFGEIITKLYDLLLRLLNIIKNEKTLTDFYRQIDSGYYKNANNISNLHSNEIAYSLIPSLAKYVETSKNKYDIKNDVIKISQQKELINMVNHELMKIEDINKIGFNEAFDNITTQLIEKVYNINNLINAAPEYRDYLMSTYGDLYQSYRFMLGARLKGFELNDIGQPSSIKNVQKRVAINNNNQKVDNTNGQYSYSELKRLVKKEFDLKSQFFKEQEELNIDEIVEISQEEMSKDGEQLSKESFEEIYGQHDPIKSYNSFLRNLFSNIRRDIIDEKTGLEIPRVVDGLKMFSMIMQLSSDIDASNIIENLQTQYQLLLDDNHIEEGEDLKAVYNYIISNKRNLQISKMMETIFNKHAIDYIFYMVTGTETSFEDNLLNNFSFTITDRLSETNQRKKKDIILSSMRHRYENNRNNSEYFESFKNLSKELNSLLNKGLNFSDVQLALQTYTNNINKFAKEIGLELPKSLIELSIIDLHLKKNNNLPKEEVLKVFNTKSVDRYNINNKFIQEEQYLSEDFFSRLYGILNQSIDNKVNTIKPVYLKLIDDENVKNTMTTQFITTLKKATAYIIKYNPKDLPNVIRNAENKKIYPYGSPNAFLTLSNLFRRDGLKSTLEQDEYYGKFLKDFLKENPLLSDLLEGKDTDLSREMNLFFRNFFPALFGGAQQRIVEKELNKITGYSEIKNTVFEDGKTYKHANKEALQYLGLLAFMQRKIFSEDKTSVETFMMTYNQLESLGTNFLIPAKYMNDLVDKQTGSLVRDKDNVTNVSKHIIHGIKREYDRIRREFKNRQEKIDKYNSKEENLFTKDYDAKWEGTTLNTDDNRLRAFNFISFADFFVGKESLRDTLISLAKSDKDFDLNNSEFLVIDGNPMSFKEFSNIIEEYIIKEYNNFLSILGTEIIERAIPNKIKEDYRFKEIENIYKTNPKNSLLKDYFFNDWVNRIMLSPIFDGDPASNVKGSEDFIKRLKKWGSSGNNLGSGTHTVAYLNDIQSYIYSTNPELGRFETKNDLLRVKDLSLREKLESEWGTNSFERVDTFDGQSYSTLEHHTFMLNQQGRVDSRAKELLIEKHFRELTESEINELYSKGIVLNAKKTVTSSTHFYHKLSEAVLYRNDVSVLRPELVVDANTRLKIYNKLRELWTDYYSLKEEGSIEEAKNLIKEIHAFYLPLPQSSILHELLNSMEYHMIDQVMDGTASKTATKLPLNLLNDNIYDNEGYLDLGFHSVGVSNTFKFNQVETSSIHNYSRASVQGKLLLPADIKNMLEKVDTSKPITDFVQNALSRYDKSLLDSLSSRFNYFNQIMRDGGDFNIGKLFDIIRQDSIAQNMPESVSSMFATENGEPVFNVNMPEIRQALEYYFFSTYSNNLTDEKVSGGAFINKSDFGLTVLVDNTTGEVITREETKRDLSKYSSSNYSVRPLTMKMEEKNGIKIYYAEAVISKPTWIKTKRDEQLFFEKLSTMVGVRIPTEDKRSMVVLKVVDFTDSSSMNEIALPANLMLLSGWDFDIDKLYYQSMATYDSRFGGKMVYGDYSSYNTKEDGQFIEYFEYMVSKKELKSKISNLIIDNKENIEITEDSKRFLQSAGFTNLLINDVIRELQDTTLSSLLDITNENIKEIKDTVKKLRDSEQVDKDENIKYLRRLLSEQNVKKSILNAIIHYEVSKTVLSDYNLPSTKEEYLQSDLDIVTPLYQNEYLQARIDLLSNEFVYNNMYINERSSVEALKSLIKDVFDLSMDDFAILGNMYSIPYIINTKAKSDMNKQGIELSASMNKFLAFASQIQAKLKNSNVVWKGNFANKDGEFIKKVYNTYGQFTEDEKRVIEIIGNILGLYADGMKIPLPPALGINEVNTSVTLAMLGLGMNQDFVFGFNYTRFIRNAVKDVQNSNQAIKVNKNITNSSYLWAINNIVSSLVTEDILNELQSFGLMKDGVLQKDELYISFNPNSLDAQKIENNEYSFKDIGYSVKGFKNELTSSTQDYVFMLLYQEQVEQSMGLLKASSFTQFFKSLNPQFVTFDRMYENMLELVDTELSLFTKETVENIINENRIEFKMLEIAKDLDEQSRKMFLERTSVMKPITDELGKYFDNNSTISNIFASFIALNAFKSKEPNKEVKKVSDKKIQSLIDRDKQNIREVFSADFWFTNTLQKEIEDMRVQFPNNKFLESITVATGNLTDSEGRKNKYTKLVGMLDTDSKTDFAYDMQQIYDSSLEGRLFIKKLFYVETARTGMQQKISGSFFNIMMPSLKTVISDYMSNFMKSSQDSNLLDIIDVASDTDAHNFFHNIFYQLALGIQKEKNANLPVLSNMHLSNSKYIPNQQKNLASLFKDAESYLNYLKDVFSVNEIKKKGNMFTLDKSFGTKFTLDFSNQSQLSANMELARLLKIPYDKNNKTFKFPLIIQVGKKKSVSPKIYLLKSIDGLNTKNLGELFVTNTKNNVFDINGQFAIYEQMETDVFTGEFSSVAFDLDTIKDFIKIDKKTKLVEDTQGFVYRKAEKTVKKPVETKSELLTKSQQNQAKSTEFIIQQNFFNKKPYQKQDGTWSIYKTKDGSLSAIDGAIKGSRTQTTRSFIEQQKLYKLAESQGLPKGTVTGTIVWMQDIGSSKNAKTQSPTVGKGGWFKITSEFYTPNKKDFNNFENWSDNVWNDRNQDFKIGTPDEWKSVRFEYIGQNLQIEETIGAKSFKGDRSMLEVNKTSKQEIEETKKSIKDDKLVDLDNAKEFLDALPILQYTQAYGQAKLLDSNDSVKFRWAMDLLETSVKVNELFSKDKPRYYILKVNKIDGGNIYHPSSIFRFSVLIDRDAKKAITIGESNMSPEGDLKQSRWITPNFVLSNINAALTHYKKGMHGTLDLPLTPSVNKIYNIVEKPFSPEPIIKETIKTDSSKFIFKDGTEINTDFILNEQQKKALQLMADYYNHDNKLFFTLEGYAGTGKTTIVKYLVDYINFKSPFQKIVFSSPTHKANAVLKFSLGNNYIVKTIHSVFGLSPNMDLENFDARQLQFVKQSDSKLGYGDMLVIDESSMLNKQLFKFITENAAKQNIKVLFMGDPMQIKPVKQIEISEVFSQVKDKYELTKVERTGDNPLLKEINKVRNTTIGDPFSYKSDVNSNDQGVVYVKSESDFLNQISNIMTLENLRKNPLLIRMVSGTNKRVLELNNTIRRGIFGKDVINEYNVGDLLMGYSNYDVDYKTKEAKIINSGDYMVTSVSSLKEGKWGDLDISYYTLTVRDIFNPDKGDVAINIISKNISEKSLEKVGEMSESLRMKALAMPKGSPQAAQAWASKSAFDSAYATPHDIKYNGSVKIKYTLDYGYAHTIHKSQGATYKYIAIDARDLNKFSDNELKRQLKYVAISRAQDKAIILHSEENTDKQILETNKTTKQPVEVTSSNQEIMITDRYKQIVEVQEEMLGRNLTETEINAILEYLKKCM